MRRRIIGLLGGSLSAGTALAGCGDANAEQAEVAGAGGDTAAAGTGVGSPACTTTQKCLSRDRVAQLLARNGRGMDAGDETAVECPFYLSESFCHQYHDLYSATEDQCCYFETIGTCCGRPMVVDGRMLRAALQLRGDWLTGRMVTTRAELPTALREALARAWHEDACFEHASIGSFALFTLDLLACGAGSDLVAAAQRAALDEVEHAKLCFGLASGFAGRALGPSALAGGAQLQTRSLTAATVAAIHEGCVGETIASVQLQAQLARARDPVVRSALRRIASDEARHAELAFRFVQWAVGEGGPELRATATDAMRSALAAAEAAPVEHADAQPVALWNAFGRLSAAQAHAARRQALREVVEPCARALLRG
jgi:hypothetical protein